MAGNEGDDDDAGQDDEIARAFAPSGYIRDPAKPEKPDWSFWLLVPAVPVQDTICLTCDVEPRWFNRGPSSGPKLLEIVKRSGELRELIALGAEIPGVAYRTYPTTGVAGFELRAFGRWARETRKWQLPDEFPMPIEKPKAATSAAASVGSWPWGTYENALLRNLSEAVRFFWADEENRRDPALKEEVVNWIMRECRISRGKADAIALIIRPDDIAPGPRKKDEE